MKLKKRISDWWDRSNKYVWPLLFAVAIALGVVLIGRPLISLVRTSFEIRELKARKESLERRINGDRTLIERLSDDAFLEQYARETFYMQRPNEQVYIIED